MNVNQDLELSDLELPHDTVVLLKELMKRKRKLENVKFLNTLLSIINLILIAIFVMWLFKISSLNAQNMLAYFTRSTPMYYIVITIGMFLYARTLTAKYKKTKDKYEELRKETITRLEADWELNFRSNKRDKISQWLSSKDINISYKS